MAWEKHYILQWYDIWNVKWTANLYTQNYPSEPIYLQGSEDAIVFEFRNDTDQAFGCLKPSSVILNVIRDTPFQFMELFTGGIMDTWVEIFQGEEDSSAGEPYWVGWLDVSNYEEPYEALPIAMQLSCVDGLTMLKDILFAQTVTTSEGDEEIIYYNNRHYISEMLLYIFDKIGYSEFKEYVNLYEEAMYKAVGDSPFDQAKIDADVFQDMYCDEVLKRILEPFNASIRQRKGVFCIYRPKELINSTVYGRHFTGVSTKTAISISTNQYFNRTGHRTNLKQVPGGNIGLEVPARRVRTYFSYESRESWLDNWKIEGNTLRGIWPMLGEAGFDFYPLHWIPNPLDAETKPVAYLVAGEEDGIAIGDTGAYFYQDILNTLQSDIDLFTLEVDWGVFNNTAIFATGIIYLKISMGSAYYLSEVDDTNCEWVGTNTSIEFGYGLGPGVFGTWQTFKRQFVGLPTNGTIRVRIYGSDADQVYACWKNIKICLSASKLMEKTGVRSLWQRIVWEGNNLVFKNKYYKIKYREAVEGIIEDEYITGNDLEGQELENNYILGDVTDDGVDNTLSQFKGALSTMGERRDTLAEVAAGFVSDHATDLLAGGVIVTASGEDIIFTAAVPGTDFSAPHPTSITNMSSGDLDGTEASTPPKHVNNTAARARVDKITFTDGIARVDTIAIDPSSTSGSADVTCEGVTENMPFGDDLPSTISDFVSAYAASYDAVDVILDYSGNTLLFTAKVPGIDFTVNDTGIVNINGDLDGIVTSPATPNTPGSSAGDCNITCEGLTKHLDFNTDVTQTLIDFVTNFAADYLAHPYHVVVTRSGKELIFTAETPGTDFTENDTAITNVTPNLDGVVTSSFVTNIVPVARVDTITLTGTNGIAEIVCDGHDAITIEMIDAEIEVPTIEWAPRDEQSSGGMKKLMELIGDEIKHQYSRHTQLLSINIKELPGEMLSPASDDDESTLDLIGNIQDTENQIDGENRVFVINRGTFKPRTREWKLDLAEIVK